MSFNSCIGAIRQDWGESEKDKDSFPNSKNPKIKLSTVEKTLSGGDGGIVKVEFVGTLHSSLVAKYVLYLDF